MGEPHTISWVFMWHSVMKKIINLCLSNLLSLLTTSHSSSADISPSPSAESSGLLSLPWEILTHIVSYLPVHFVVNVLPKVCHALSNVGQDRTSWQLRAQRLVGLRAAFPVGPREDFDWPGACLQMEQLITCWSGEVEHVARQNQEDEERREQAMPQDGEPGVGGQDDGGEGQVEWQVFIANEGRDAVLNHQEDLPDHRNLGNGQHVEARSPSPPPALECITLPTGHIAHVNSVLLLGGEGKVCATASRDWNVKLWDLELGSLLQTMGRQGDFSSHRGWVWCLASQGPLLASGGFDSTVRLWDLQAGGADRALIRTGAAVLCLSCQPDMLLAGTFDKRVSMYDTRAAAPLVKSIRMHSNAVMCLCADDKYIISGSKDCTVAVYDRRAGKGLKRLRLSSYLLSMSYSGCEVWAGDNGGMLHSFSMQAGTLKPVSQFDVGHTALITGIHRSPGSLYTCSSDCTVKVREFFVTLSCWNFLSVEAGVLAIASGDVRVQVWRPRK
uniref:F-box and WD repeat domain containing 9 n=1 Tax=Maylandia zebra TaxID=106582 RepID=A0A3P9BYY2_9CICH